MLVLQMTSGKTEIQNTQAEDLGIFFTPKFGEGTTHRLHTSGDTTNIPCTKGEMNSKKDVIHGLSQTFQQYQFSKNFKRTLDSK